MNKHPILFNQVIDYAKKNKQIRVVEMNGSRVNDLIESDEYQDYDIVFYVEDFDEFMKSQSFVSEFGDILVMQTKDDQIIIPEIEEEPWYVYLVQYKDGTRLDLTIKEVLSLDKSLNEDSLSMIVLDKDNHDITSNPNESSYYIKEPTQKEFHRVVNEFYWVSPYVGKGIARQHLFYAYKHLNIIRKQIEFVLDWWIGIQHDFKISAGKGKHRYNQLLPKSFYLMYEKTYADIQLENIIAALFNAIRLFNDVCIVISQYNNFEYDQSLKDQMIKFIKEQYIKNES